MSSKKIMKDCLWKHSFLSEWAMGNNDGAGSRSLMCPTAFKPFTD